MLKTGFLLPRSTVYPLIGHDFLDGFKSYFGDAAPGEEPVIATANIGFGIDEAEVYTKNEELLLKENVDVVIAFMDGRSAEMIQPLFTATGKILLLVNMGAHYSYESAPSSTTINHTFDVAFNSWLTGKLASASNHPKAIFTTSYYDGGYLQCFCMATRYLNDGNSITNNFVTHFKKELFNTEDLELCLKEHADIDTLLCLFSGDTSPLMYKALSDLQQQRNLNLFVSPMMLDESLKMQLDTNMQINNVKGYTVWNSKLDNAFNRKFTDQFRRFSGREPGIFGMLGWEAGTILSEIDKLYKAGSKGINAVTDLMKMKLNSPRGWLKFDEKIQQTYSPSQLVSVHGNFDPVIERSVEDNTNERNAFIASKPVGAASGWRNTYLCS
jgi:branched-chain amino acid transport system substrate-binding protein